jgi:nuclear transport factor 2 (NTF2) superfamily protein
MADRPPLPPFTRETAARKVQAAEDAWNTRDPHKVALAYSEDSVWRNRDTFLTGRAEIVAFLTAKWAREQEYALRKDLWAFDGNRIAVRFQYESRDADGRWWRSYGNECPGRQRLPVKERRPVRALGVPAESPRTGRTWAFGRCGEWGHVPRH